LKVNVITIKHTFPHNVGRHTNDLTGKVENLLKRLARWSAWALLAGLIVLVVSGWGITQTGVIYTVTFGLVDRRLADAIHRAANLPVAFFFLSHVLINIKVAISQKYPSGGITVDIVLVLAGIILMAIVVYMEYFRLGG
jgi:thiosulfate reductase cytochrome b subunit